MVHYDGVWHLCIYMHVYVLKGQHYVHVKCALLPRPFYYLASKQESLIFPILNVRIGRSSQHALMLHACRKVRLCVHLPRNLYEQPLTRQTTHASKKLV